MENNNRYILFLNQDDKSAIRKTEKEFGKSVTSSAELSTKVRSQNIYDSGNGLYLKNIGVVVLDEPDEEKLDRFLKNRRSPLKHYELSKKIFRPVSELEILKQLKKSNQEISEQIKLLEMYFNDSANIEDTKYTWGLNAIGIQHSKLDGTDVDICILDTGFYKKHPDFKGRDITGKSFVPNESWEDDKNGHGTHCTGTAAGFKSLKNGIRYGIASASRIAIGKVLDNTGSGSTDWILDAIDNCIEKKYKVISMSLGAPVSIGEQPNTIFEHVGQVALENNCLLIAAAGNESQRPNLPRPVNMPGNCESFMAVAALDSNLHVASFSNGGINANNGGKIDVSAPGVSVYSSYSPNAPGKKLHKTLKGTSMATPHVSGLAALYCEAFPNLSASEIWRRLEKKAKQLNNQLIRDVGNGLVQAI